MRKNIILLALISIGFQSCLVKALMKKVGIYDKTNTIEKISNGEKDLCFLPMHHIGKQEFYDDTKSKLDSLSKNGYYIFFEGIQGKEMADKNERDIMYKKLRKLSGIDLLKMGKGGGYIDSTGNQSVFENPLLDNRIKKDKLVNQPASLRKTADSKIGMQVDGSITDMITKYESKYGKIVLDSIDLNIALGDKYEISKANKISKEKRKYLILDIRNEIITNQIVNSPYKKIVLVYGKGHYEGFMEGLKRLDAKFEAVK